MISVKDLYFSYSGTIVLDGISIDFIPGRIYGIVGLNGSGKTTFFNAVSCSLKPVKGQIDFNGRQIHSRDIAYLETVNYFYSKITGNEYLEIFKQTNREFNLSSLQEYFKLPLNDIIDTYSTGMKKKLALLSVLKQNKPIFLFDEPFNGLDMETNKVLELIITILKEKEKTVFVSSHIIDPLLSICDQIHFLENGKFTKTYTKENFEKMEEELFRKLKTEAKILLSNSI